MSTKGTDTSIHQMQQLWQSVLATKQAIKVDDNFFELGGTWSAVALMSTKAAAHGLFFAAEDIYEHPRLYDLTKNCGTGAKLVAEAAPNSDQDPAASFPVGSTTTGEAIWQTCDLQPQLLCHPTGCLRAPTTLVRAALALMLGKYEDSVKVALGTASSEVPMSPIVCAWVLDEKTEAFLDRIQQLSKAASQPSSTDLKIRCGVQFTTVLDASQYDDTCLEVRRSSPSMALYIHCLLSADRVSLIGGSYNSILSLSSLRRVLDQIQYVVQQLAVCQSDDTLRNLQYVSPRDRQQLLEWNRILPLEVTACIHEQFDSVVRQQPDATAVDAWDGTFSYRELETYASHLAAYLAGRGITREVVVGICYEKSKWAVLCMLATLKAGGVCLFLDPEAPRMRRESILHDAKVKFLLTSTTSLEDVIGGIPCLAISDPFFDTLEPSLPSRLAVLSKPLDAAFISFSSGSTGIPKASVSEQG
ncbi:hypothetical protein FOTG_17292 [Fusarium oxysporum f. sp. vasinfectum 25433]|uniref:AMP-dependent synthetase/ligase domain-containing protein n=1 Tax=Fusarium oxysporum f. sp. vasinfectum 25433 TaxID=1089449 RepID=X0KL32_FUSOX|nr:hypothetical protein FOTG_17292 [Fusarium oxysporum f. sp. vasinfectum 25433]